VHFRYGEQLFLLKSLQELRAGAVSPLFTLNRGLTAPARRVRSMSLRNGTARPIADRPFTVDDLKSVVTLICSPFERAKPVWSEWMTPEEALGGPLVFLSVTVCSPSRF